MSGVIHVIWGLLNFFLQVQIFALSFKEIPARNEYHTLVYLVLYSHKPGKKYTLYFNKHLYFFFLLYFLRNVGRQTKGKINLPSSSKSQFVGQAFELFQYPAFEFAAQSGTIDTFLYQKFVRGTIDLMNSTSWSALGRLPNSFELQEMAKSIVVKYPILGDFVSH